ncbi:hypothetical protein AMTR_s00137p00117610 [Amborella trichopoda]|uniref:Uncharacterized protein n=1 Tax=Amborella trichopoda TaxID=13333 RepID=W1NEV6_AMBTC|nr:hypothetical protein AMTR_s00137p00117610 [Amborella trichopoda]
MAMAMAEEPFSPFIGNMPLLPHPTHSLPQNPVETINSVVDAACLAGNPSLPSTPPMAQARTNFPATFQNKPNFPLTIPAKIQWALTTSGLLRPIADHLERKQECATWKELNPTALRPLAPHQVNGVDLNNSDSDDDGSDDEWAPSLDAVLGVKGEVPRIADPFNRKQQRTTWKEMHPTALRPLSPHQVNVVESDGDNTSDGDLLFSWESSPSLSSRTTRLT